MADIYPLPDAKQEDMVLSAIVQARQKSPPLRMCDIRPKPISVKSYQIQSAVNVVKFLLRFVPQFGDSYYVDSPLLKNLPRSPRDPKKIMVYHTAWASPIEEASTEGNNLVHEDIYFHQFRFKIEDMDLYAIPTCNDQLTNSQIRSGQIIRKNDVGGFNTRQIFELGLALFHLVINLIWVIREIHYGSLSEVGTLAHLFLLLDKTCLGNPKPDFHTLLAALDQIVSSLILVVWEIECGNLEAFAATKPTPEQLIEFAHRIIDKYATPSPDFPPSYTLKGKKQMSASASEKTEPKTDTAKGDIARLLRDLLLVTELVSAIKEGDFGWIEDILPDLAFLFRGAGSNNYSTEILHILHSIKHVRTPAFADIMCDIMLVNVSGLPGHFMGIDLNIEHLIRYLKALFLAKGYYANWDRCGNISAAIGNLMVLKRRITKTMSVRYQGKTHTQADMSGLVSRLVSKAKELQLLETIPGRSDAKLKPDLRSLGHSRIESSTLAAFNTKLAVFQKTGKTPPVIEVDEISTPTFADRSELSSLSDTIDNL